MIFNEFTLDFTNILVALASAVIIYFAWKSTNVREDRIGPAAVLIIENNRRRLLDSIVREPTITAHTAVDRSDNSDVTDELNLEQNERISVLQDLHLPEAPPSLQAIIDEVNDLASSRTTASNFQSLESAVEEDINQLLQESDSGPQRIIQVMDNSNSSIVEHRRVNIFNESTQPTEGTSRSTPIRRENLNVPSGDTVDNSHAENCSNENNENENISKTECRSTSEENDATNIVVRRKTNTTQDSDTKEEFRIKLKYLNDELRLVKGSPNEAVGDFKKRNFTVELSAQKLVRLVFNGHVLQPDSKTLKACGLFDNCVVHCLIHTKKPSAEESGRNNQSESQSNRNGDIGSNTFEESSSGVSLVYFGIILSGLSIILGWYCRFTYSFIFSWYSTIGLGLMTLIFLVLSPVLYLIERGVSL